MSKGTSVSFLLTLFTIERILVFVLTSRRNVLTMHLEGPWLSTTGKKKGKKKWASAEAKAKAETLDENWKALQKKWGVEAEEKKRKRALESDVWQPKPKSYRGSDEHKIPSLPFSGGVCTKPDSPVYTGTKVKGIGTMHKSNAVPIFSDEEAVDISKMRR